MILELDLFLMVCGWCHKKFGGEDRFCSLHWSRSHVHNLTWSSFREPLSPTHSLASLVFFMFFDIQGSLLPWDFCTCLSSPSAFSGISWISIWLTFLNFPHLLLSKLSYPVSPICWKLHPTPYHILYLSFVYLLR